MKLVDGTPSRKGEAKGLDEIPGPIVTGRNGRAHARPRSLWQSQVVCAWGGEKSKHIDPGTGFSRQKTPATSSLSLSLLMEEKLKTTTN